MTAHDPISRLDDGYPAYTMGRAADMLGTTQGFKPSASTPNTAERRTGEPDGRPEAGRAFPLRGEHVIGAHPVPAPREEAQGIQAGLAMTAGHAGGTWSFDKHGLKVLDTTPSIALVPLRPAGPRHVEASAAS